MTPQDRRRAQRRGSSLERTAAAALGSRRVARIGSKRREPDLAPIVLATGETLVAECKSRKRLPRLLVEALEQARRYAPGAVPIAVLREAGSRALVALELEAFVRLTGIAPEVLPTRHRPTRRRPSAAQLSLPLAKGDHT